MTSQIKITQLTDIGSANLSVTTLLPVVNMAGVPTTQKTTLGNLANVILSQSGGNYAPVGVANLSYSVTNAAQPNITSVGTLTSLTVSGNVDLGPVANVRITGGSAGQILSTDGAGNLSWVSDANSTYGNANVVSLLAAFGSNTITTTGNVSAGQLIGNGHYITSLPGANVAGQVNYAAVANSVAGGNVGGEVAYANTANNVAGINVTGFVANANVANTAYSVSAGNVVGLGNIATINLDGNVSNVLRGDGTWGVDSANTGNIIFSGSNISTNTNNANLRINGFGTNSHVVITANGYGWTFEPYGNFGIPDGTVLGSFNSNNATGFNVGANNQFQIRTQDGNVYDWYFTQGGNFVTPGHILPDANITYDLGSSTQRWKDLWIANSTIYLGDLSLSVSNTGEVATSQLIDGGEGIGGISYVEWTTASTLSIRTDDTSAFIPVFESLKINDSFKLLTGGNGLVANTVISVSNTITQTTPVPGYVDFSIPVDNAPVSNVYVYLFNLTRAPVTEFSQLSGNTINLGNAVLTANGNTLVVNSIEVTNGNVGTIGNIASINLNGNINNVLRGDGTWGADANNSYGNADVANYLPTYTGNVGANWVIATYFMGNAHNLTFLPGANINGAVPYANTANSVALGNVSGIGNIANINLDGSSSNILYGNGVFAAAPSGGGLPLANGNSNFDIATVDGNVTITANSTSIWTFDNSGNLVLAGGSSVIQSIANSSLDPLNPNVSTMTLTPDANYNSQVLVLDPTAPGHIHLRAYAFSNIDEPAANIFLGGENTSFEVTSGPNNEARIHSNNYTWTYGTDGNLTLPGSLLPTSDGNYDLGSNANRWRDLYLSGNTIYLGANATISAMDDDILIGTPNIDLTFGGGAFTMANAANANNTFSIALFDDGADILVNGNVGGNLTFGGGAFVAETSQIIGNVVTSNTANIKNALINISLDVDANAAINFKDANGNIAGNILLADDDILINNGNVGDLIFKGGAFTIANISNANNAFSIALFDDGADILVNGNQGNLTFGGGAFVMAANASIGFADANGNILGNILLADDDILINTGPGGNLVFTGGAFVANTTDLRIGNTPTPVVVPVGVPIPVATKFSVVDGSFQQGNGDMWTDGFLYAANGIYTGANISANNIGNISGINLDGSNSNVLYGNGVFAPGGGGGTPAGSNNQIQYNSNGVFAASGNYTFTDTVGGGTVTVGNELNLLGNGTIGTANGNLNIQPAGNVVVTTSIYSWVYNLDGTLSLPTSTYGYAQLYTTGANLYLGNSGNPINIQPDGTISSNANVSANVGLFNDLNLNNAGTNAFLYTDSNRNIYDTQFGYDSANDTMSGGNISLTGTISATNIGNISGINLDGNASNVLYGNGVFAAPTSGYGNSNVTTLLSSFGSNTISTTGNISGGNVLASGTSSNVIRRAFGLVASDVGVTLDDLTVTVSSSTSQLTLQTSGSWQGTGWTETFAGGATPTVNNWINLPLNPGFTSASGAMNTQGNGCRCIISDQTPSAKVYQITVVRSGTTGAQWNISIERLV